MVNAIEAFDAKHLKPAEEIPEFRAGDTVEVNVKIKEGNNSRIQTFTGVVIARHNRLHQGRASWPRASRQAVLPARSARQGCSYRRASRQLQVSFAIMA